LDRPLQPEQTAPIARNGGSVAERCSETMNLVLEGGLEPVLSITPLRIALGGTLTAARASD